MKRIWNSVTLDVDVDYEDFEAERERMIARGEAVDYVRVPVEVDIGDALEEATVDQLREALGREGEGWTQCELDAIRDSFAAAVRGDVHTASALLNRIFKHDAQIAAAEYGLSALPARQAA